MQDPDPGGPKTYGFGTLILTNKIKTYRRWIWVELSYKKKNSIPSADLVHTV